MCIAVEVINRDGGVAAKEISNEMTADSPLSDSLICLCCLVFLFPLQVLLECRVFLDTIRLFLIFSYVQR